MKGICGIISHAMKPLHGTLHYTLYHVFGIGVPHYKTLETSFHTSLFLLQRDCSHRYILNTHSNQQNEFHCNCFSRESTNSLVAVTGKAGNQVLQEIYS